MRNRIFWLTGIAAAGAAVTAWAATLGIYPTISPLGGTDMIKTYVHGQPVTNTGSSFVNTFNDVWRFGHTVTAPTGNNCTIVGTDAGGVATMGASTTTCTITFASTWTTTPDCVVTWQANLAAMGYTIAPTTLTVTQTSTSSDLVNYYCRPRT